MKKFIKKNPMTMICIGVMGIGMFSIFVKFSAAPSPITAAWRLLWTVLLMTPVVLGKRDIRRQFSAVSPKNWLQTSGAAVIYPACGTTLAWKGANHEPLR